MKLIPIKQQDFQLWGQYRLALYSAQKEEDNESEMGAIHQDDNWFCRFIENDAGKVIGMVELSLRNIVDGCSSSPVPYLEGLYLEEAERGKGLGAQILQMLIDWCKGQGYTEFATDAEIVNQRAQMFYENAGFEVIDRVVEYRLELN